MLESSSNRFGLGSSLYAKCSGCGMSEFLASGNHPQDDVNPRTLQGKDVNRRMVFAAFESGIGKGVAKFCEVFNMPFNISPDTCYSHEEILSQAFQEETSEQLQKNCAEARKLAMLEEALDDNDDNVTIVHIPISFDGTWSKRGYTANHCIGFLISAATGRVLDFEVISKVCQQCTQMKAKLDEAGFNDWYQDHICEGSYKGSSPSMEMECAKRLWGRSENNYVR